MKTARKHERCIEDLEDDIRVTPGFGFYLRPSYCLLAHKESLASGLASLLSEHELDNTPRSPEAVWRGHCSVRGREFQSPFSRGFYGAQAFGASASHEISHMRSRYSALFMAAQRGRRTEQISRHYLALRRMNWRHFSAEEPWVLEWIWIPSYTLHTRGKFELTNQDSAGGKNSSVLDEKLTRQERHWNQAAFLTGDGVKYPRKGILNFKNHTNWQKV